MADLESNGHAAVTFVRPVDERACQLKGTFVSARAAKDQRARARDVAVGRILRSLEVIGIPRANLTKWVTWPAMAIRLRTTALFDQTPGPHAGTPLT